MKLVENDKVKLRDVVSNLISNSTEIRLAMAFVRKSGVEAISSDLQAFKARGGKLKLIFGEDFNLTDSSALEYLHTLNADMKVYLSRKGVYHPKIWMFKLIGKWVIVIGSSNLSRDALTNNVEANLVFEGDDSDADVKACLSAYDALWKSERSYTIGTEYIKNYKNEVKRYFKRRISITTTGKINAVRSYDTLKDVIKSWIDIPVSDKVEKNSIWRGWYFLPNQTVITDGYLSKLQKILVFIKSHRQYRTAGYLDIPSNTTGEQICKDIQTYADITFKRKSLRLSARDLFVRQQKNYLEKLGLITEEQTKIRLTNLGEQFSSANLTGIKAIYEDILIDYKWYAIRPFLFLLRLLLALQDNILLYDEFSFFVIHTKHDTEFDVVYDSIMTYRLLPSTDRDNLIKEMHGYLQTAKGSGAKMVIEDYNLKLDFFLKDMGVLDYLDYDNKTGNLKLTDATKAQNILSNSDYP